MKELVIILVGVCIGVAMIWCGVSMLSRSPSPADNYNLVVDHHNAVMAKLAEAEEAAKQVKTAAETNGKKLDALLNIATNAFIDVERKNEHGH